MARELPFGLELVRHGGLHCPEPARGVGAGARRAASPWLCHACRVPDPRPRAPAGPCEGGATLESAALLPSCFSVVPTFHFGRGWPGR
jgi:hypothetical protein